MAADNHYIVPSNLPLAKKTNHAGKVEATKTTSEEAPLPLVGLHPRHDSLKCALCLPLLVRRLVLTPPLVILHCHNPLGTCEASVP